ncbi:MAG: diguanylate cyclase [Pleurocapsa sp. MO_226.B13]|nr:diguanylate cyclase [Pleurocapsa sp. MO_226.B13]
MRTGFGIKTVSEPFEWLWVLTWASIGAGVNLLILNRSSVSKHDLSLVQSTTICIIIPGAILFSSGYLCYLLFLAGWWLPAITPLFSLIASTIAVSNHYQKDQKKLAFTDGLTQIPNHRFFDRFLEQHWLESQRKHQSLCLILCDVDHFKKYNDTYSHQAGDLCLQKVALVLSQSVRSNDLAARYGGEEFADRALYQAKEQGRDRAVLAE